MKQTFEKTKASVTTLSKLVECAISPIVLFKALALDSDSGDKNRMLLESCKIEDKQELKSILINKSALKIQCFSNQVIVRSLTSNGDNAIAHLAKYFSLEASLDSSNSLHLVIEYSNHNEQQCDEETRLKRLTPIDCLRQINQAFKSNSGQEYSVFLAGLFAFDFIASFEDLPSVQSNEKDCADYVFYLAEEIIVFDHQTLRCHIYSNIFEGDVQQQNYFEQSRRIEKIAEIMTARQTQHLDSDSQQRFSTKELDAMTFSNDVNCDITDQQYQDIVVKLKEEIVAGNVFQVVPSRTFSLECESELLSYQILKQTNPSPYMFYMLDEDFILFGASPESALKYQTDNNHVDLYPIAGTRPRGKYADGQIDHDLDKRLEADLKLDNKEVSEHMMLVDLARNDIARVSKTGSIQIPKLLEVDRYSQVMHLVSCVQGELLDELDAFHAYQACMNMGTLTGAPKIKATELIRNTEKKRRGSYGGAVGYINSKGDMDTCIVIRSAFCQDGKAKIQAGAGIVYDSNPIAEADETRSKANAVIRAIKIANHFSLPNEVIHHE